MAFLARQTTQAAANAIGRRGSRVCLGESPKLAQDERAIALAGKLR